MLNLIRLEFMKWKRSRFLLAALASMLIAPFVATVSTYSKMHNPSMTVDWDSFFGVALQVNLSLIFPILFGALTAYVFVQEYQDRTVITLFTLPHRRSSIFLAKIITILVTLLTLIILNTVLTFLGGKLMLSQPLTSTLLFKHAYLSIITGIMALCFIPIFAYVGMRTRHFIPPLVGATGFTFLNFASLVSPTYGPYVPTAIPVFYFLNAIGWGTSHIPFVWSLLLPVLVLSLCLCLKEYSTQEIH